VVVAYRQHRNSGLALLVMTVIALAFGWHLVASIGGADMPVVVSMLNSYRLGGGGGGLYAQQRPADS
jgi:NAD(P) transhydrogenase subunit beta